MQYSNLGFLTPDIKWGRLSQVLVLFRRCLASILGMGKQKHISVLQNTLSRKLRQCSGGKKTMANDPHIITKRTECQTKKGLSFNQLRNYTFLSRCKLVLQLWKLMILSQSVFLRPIHHRDCVCKEKTKRGQIFCLEPMG